MSGAEWYIPTHVDRWRECGGVGVDPLTELLALNHPEAVSEEERVDYELFGELFAEEREESGASEEQVSMTDIMAAISSQNSVVTAVSDGGNDGGGDGGDDGGGDDQVDLIDKFLELKDLRIVAPSLEDEIAQSRWEQAEVCDVESFEDAAMSEELAAIYLSQGLFHEAKEIYSRLFLLYSEKSVYFAGQIEKIEKKQLN